MEKGTKIPTKCPNCGKKVVLFSGISKEGRYYKFYGCEDRLNCRWSCKKPSSLEERDNEEMTVLREIYKKLLQIEKKSEFLWSSSTSPSPRLKVEGK